MENKKTLKTGLIIIFSLLIISLILSLYLKLDEPVFLKVYKEVWLPNTDTGHYTDTQLQIRYITNINDNRLINHVEFEEAPGLRASPSSFNHMSFSMFNDNDRISGDNVGRYSVRSIYLYIDAYEVENTGEEIHLTKAKIHFNNGDIVETDIGEIILYTDDIRDKHLKFISGGGSSDNTHTTTLKVLEDITLLKVEDSLLNKFNYLVDLKINNTDYENIAGVELKVGDNLSIFSKFSNPMDMELGMYDFDFHPKLHYKDSEGNSYTYRFRNIDYRRHSFEFMEIIKFLRARVEL